MPDSVAPEFPLELSPEAFQSLVDAAMARLRGYVARIPEMSSVPTAESAAVARELREDLPEEGAPVG